MNKDNLITTFYKNEWYLQHGQTIHIKKDFLFPISLTEPNTEKYEDYLGSKLCVQRCYSFICFIVAALLHQPWYILAIAGIAGYFIGSVFLFVSEIFPLGILTIVYNLLETFRLPILAPVVISVVYKDAMIALMYLAVLLVRAWVISQILFSMTRKISMNKYGLPYIPNDYKAFSVAKKFFRSHFQLALRTCGLPKFYKVYLEGECDYDTNKNDLVR